MKSQQVRAVGNKISLENEINKERDLKNEPRLEILTH